MDTLKYIELAKSKDESRYNLTSVYRDKNHLVATDGHRLHMSNGLPDAKPHFLDGTDATFPDYEQVLPKTPPMGRIEYVHIGNNGKRILNTLKQLAKLVSNYDKAHVGIKLICEKEKPVKIGFKHPELTFEHVIESFVYNGPSLEMGLNLNYLIDALAYLPDTSCEIRIRGNASAIEIVSMGLPSQLTAIVMPQRI